MTDSVSSPSTDAHHLPESAQLDMIEDSVEAEADNGMGYQPKVTVTPRRKAGEPKPHEMPPREIILTKEMLSKYFGVPLPVVAGMLGIGSTVLKSSCRKLGLERWPMPPGRPRKERHSHPTAVCSSSSSPRSELQPTDTPTTQANGPERPSVKPVFEEKDMTMVMLMEGLHRRRMEVLGDLAELGDTPWRMDVSVFLAKDLSVVCSNEKTRR